MDRDATAALSSPAPVLATQGLCIGAGTRTLLQDFSFELRAGEFLAILGRNGCGKSLTLHSLAGLRAPLSGSVQLAGVQLKGLSRRDIARQLGLLPQDREESLPLSVLDSTLIGRHPHLRAWQQSGADDEARARAALSQFGLDDCVERQLGTLSGGEQRRAAMAMLLTQAPAVFLLDEPTNHLDPHQQLQVMEVFRGQRATGAAVIATLHDPALADRYADRVLLMFGDGRWRLGPTAEVLNAAELSELYLTPFNELGAQGRRAFVAA
jgi:iron complex transport system ATP-binding protein